MKITNTYLRKVFTKVKSEILYNFFLSKNIQLGKKVIFFNKPIITVHKNALIKIGNNVMINSKNYGYQVNMFQRCKLIANRPNAELIIGDNSRIHGSCINAQKKISIGKNCLIAANCQIFDCNGHDLSLEKPENRINTTGIPREIIIENNVWIGTGVIILPGVKIEEGSVISANSVVNMDIPKNVLAGGNPVKIIKRLN